jgi:hypothetical protein
MPLEIVGKVLHFLEENGLVRKEGDRYLPTQTWVRIDKNSPLIVKHHTNWRQKAIQNLEQEAQGDLHYSGVFSIDAATAYRIKDNFLETIKTQAKLCEAAKEEDLYIIGVDFFSL